MESNKNPTSCLFQADPYGIVVEVQFGKCDRGAVGQVWDDGSRIFVSFRSSNPRPWVIVHEAVHVVQALARITGTKFDIETEAYLVEFIFVKLSEVMRQYRKIIAGKELENVSK